MGLAGGGAGLSAGGGAGGWVVVVVVLDKSTPAGMGAPLPIDCTPVPMVFLLHSSCIHLAAEKVTAARLLHYTFSGVFLLPYY